ncbi:type 1 glutamine amidotransferase domain-containing protein [Flavobacterium sp. UBA6031]|uniref:type 1 glutamine amidotransferase domain-containing protein n=1 Tax=Flavobacterium sp. UBA6031 TaxID=1946551 RepID=UPI0025B804F1|nr:type 1 glutamine amidotransferase domain-containing protein [Flavobacterium sp. UBA6031]
MEKQLNKKRVAVLATDGFEQSELKKPVKALKKEGFIVDIISLKKGKIRGWKYTKWGNKFKVDVTINQAFSSNYDMLVLPGGVINTDTLRTNELAVRFVAEFFEQEKPVAAICHAGSILIETGLLKGKQMTSYISIKTDLINAGVDWKDEEVVMDNKLITSRSPKDLPAFCQRIIEEVKKEIPVSLVE